jgi:hypothetical protein
VTRWFWICSGLRSATTITLFAEAFLGARGLAPAFSRRGLPRRVSATFACATHSHGSFVRFILSRAKDRSWSSAL